MTIRKTTLIFGSILVAAGVGYAAPASAQATRTWVSGVGDDVNPCSRTAPCKTFAGAISKTAAGGEINCLDPGGFGAVTITKAMTISCPYTEGGALAGGNGIVVNALATDVVFLRGLDIFGVNPPTNGVRFIAGAALHIEDSTIRRFNAVNSQGISFQPSGSSELFVTRTTIADNGSGATGGGILIQPTGATGNARVILNNVRVINNANRGVGVITTSNTGAGVRVSIENSEISGNAGHGLLVTAAAGTAAVNLLMNNSVLFFNGIAMEATGSLAQLRVGNTTITGNDNGVIAPVGGAIINTYGNNRLAGNGADGAFTPGVIPEQ